MRTTWLGLAVAIGAALPAAAQERRLTGTLVTGDANGVTGGKVVWTIADPDFSAIALTQFITSGVAPVGPGWGHLAMAGQARPLAEGAYDTPLMLALGTGPITFYGGTVPAGTVFRGGPGSKADTPSVGGGGGGSVLPPITAPSGVPILGLRVGIPDVQVPEAGPFAEAGFDLTGSDGVLLRSNGLTIPDGGWWALELEGTGFDPEPNPTPGPTVPEPGTLALAGIGLALVGWRRMRQR